MNDRAASKNKPVTLDPVLSFGKHKNKTIEWIVENEPSYILWLDEENILNIPDEIYNVAEIKDAKKWEDEYGFDWGLDFGRDD